MASEDGPHGVCDLNALLTAHSYRLAWEHRLSPSMCPLLLPHSPARERSQKQSSELSLSPGKPFSPGWPSKAFTTGCLLSYPSGYLPHSRVPPSRPTEVDFHSLLALTIPFTWKNLPPNSPLVKTLPILQAQPRCYGV